MEKITKAFRVRKKNVERVKVLAKNDRRNIGDTLDLIIEYYFSSLKNHEESQGDIIES